MASIFSDANSCKSSQFLHRESQIPISALFAENLVWLRKENIMDYLVVLVTASMIALYAFIIGRSLPKH